jgi:HK97 family phage prohead protease/HK97 family phage major capsid protein
MSIQTGTYAADVLAQPVPISGPAPPDLHRTNGAFAFKSFTDKADDGTEEFYGAGWASKPDVDSYKEIVKPDAFNESLPEFMRHPMMLYMHDWYGMPVGMVTSVEVREEGIWVEFKIFQTTEGRNLIICIREGLIDSLSIGFSVAKDGYEFDEESGIGTITKGRLLEVSVVTLGACPTALFSEKLSSLLRSKDFDINKAKSIINDAAQGEDYRDKLRSVNMADMTLHEVSKKVDDLNLKHDDALSGVTKSVKDVNSELEKFKAEFLDTAKNAATADAVDSLAKNVEKDVGDLHSELNKIKNAVEINSRRESMHSWMSKMYSNRGREKMDIILRSPVDTASHPEGDLLKATRHAFDELALVHSMLSFKHGVHNVDLTKLKTFDAFTGLLSYYAPDEAESLKAMSGGTAGSGAEWLMTGFSQNMHDLYDMERKLERYMPQFDMPQKTFEWPAKLAHAVAYPISEASVNNPTEMRKSDWTTGDITFVAKDSGAAFPISSNLEEDSIVAIGPVVMEELAFGLSSAWNDALLNGNDDATVSGDTWTNDLDTGYSTWALNKCKNLIPGLRLYASDLSATINFASTTAGVGDGAATFGPKDIMSLFVKMDKHADNPELVKLVMPLIVYLKILCFNERAQMGTYGGVGTYNTKDRLDHFAGYEMLVDPDYSSLMTAAGIYDGSTKTHTGCLAFKPREFKQGNRRGIVVEYDKNIYTQQTGYVATQRKAFKKMCVSTEFPVAAGYGITTAGL